MTTSPTRIDHGLKSVHIVPATWVAIKCIEHVTVVCLLANICSSVTYVCPYVCNYQSGSNSWAVTYTSRMKFSFQYVFNTPCQVDCVDDFIYETYMLIHPSICLWNIWHVCETLWAHLFLTQHSAPFYKWFWKRASTFKCTGGLNGCDGLEGIGVPYDL